MYCCSTTSNQPPPSLVEQENGVSLSSSAKIALVAIGVLAAIAGILILAGAPVISQLGSAAGWSMLSVGIVDVLIMAALHYYYKKPKFDFEIPENQRDFFSKSTFDDEEDSQSSTFESSNVLSGEKDPDCQAFQNRTQVKKEDNSSDNSSNHSNSTETLDGHQPNNTFDSNQLFPKRIHDQTPLQLSEVEEVLKNIHLAKLNVFNMSIDESISQFQKIHEAGQCEIPSYDTLANVADLEKKETVNLVTLTANKLNSEIEVLKIQTAEAIALNFTGPDQMPKQFMQEPRPPAIEELYQFWLALVSPTETQ